MSDQGLSGAFPRHFSSGDAYRLAERRWVRPVRSARVPLEGGVEATAGAREAITHHLGGVVPERRLDDVRLLVNELVTNGLLHGDGNHGMVLHLAASAGRVRVEVCDGGSGFEFSREPRDARTVGGHGLRILDLMASRWGVSGDAGTCVWFELDLE